MLRDPVCGRKMNPNKVYVQIEYKNEMYYLCCPLCQSELEKEPEKYLKTRNGKGKRNIHCFGDSKVYLVGQLSNRTNAR